MKTELTNLDFLPIKAWAEEDRPREKLLLKGKASLSDAELIAILMNTGTQNETVLDISKKLLLAVQNNLSELSKLSIRDLTQFKGIGEAKAITITAALELGKRRREQEAAVKKLVKTSQEAYEQLRESFEDKPHEEFWILMLNKANRVIGKELVSKGGLTGTIADQRVIFKKAIDVSACGLIMAHNHPSGNANPSQADLLLTRKMVEAGKILDIAVLDHLIITEKEYYSFADEGNL